MACTKACELPSASAAGRLNLSFRYGMNEIGMDYSRGSAIYTKALFAITFVRRFDCGKPAHIYKKPDFSNDDSMGKKRMLCIMQLVVFTTS